MWVGCILGGGGKDNKKDDLEDNDNGGGGERSGFGSFSFIFIKFVGVVDILVVDS